VTVLAWDGCVNVRDLGGLPLEDGGETARRVVVRSDSVRALTDAGWDALRSYGVERVVDLRFAEERAEDPPRETPVELVHVPLLGAADEHRATFWARLDATEEPADYYRWAYAEFLRRFPSNFASAVSAVAEADAPVVVHCAGGKDRTGLVCALALRLAGVPVDAVADDWVLSERSWAPHDVDWIASAPDEVERKRRRVWGAAPREAMVEVVAGLDARAYLEDAGVEPRLLDRLRARLRGAS
jgi:protein tyrosine/serine phosphatase